MLRISTNYGRYCTSGVCVASGEEQKEAEAAVKEEGEEEEEARSPNNKV